MQAYMVAQTKWMGDENARRLVQMQEAVMGDRERCKAIKVQIVEVSLLPQTAETVAQQEKLRLELDCHYQAEAAASSPAPPALPPPPDVTAVPA